MRENNRPSNLSHFIERIDAANRDLGGLRELLSELAGVDARLKRQLDRMEQTEKQIAGALKVLQQVAQLRNTEGFNGYVGASAHGDNNGRNAQQWQTALARLVFGDDSGIR